MAPKLAITLSLAVATCTFAAWTVQWQEDFDGPAGAAPNNATWTAKDMPGLSGNQELEYYAPERCYLDGAGSLVLESLPDDAYKGYNYTSCWVDTASKKGFLGGRLEVRAKLPTGQGIWPAHWLMPDYPGAACWPRGGEIDILERIDTVQQVHGALHWANASTDGCGDAVEENGGNWSAILPQDPSLDFHLYGIIWNLATDCAPLPGLECDAIYWYYDTWDQPYTQVLNVSSKFEQKNFHFILNTAVGGSWPGAPNASTVWPQYHLVDRVTAYTWTPDGGTQLQ